MEKSARRVLGAGNPISRAASRPPVSGLSPHRLRRANHGAHLERAAWNSVGELSLQTRLLRPSGSSWTSIVSKSGSRDHAEMTDTLETLIEERIRKAARTGNVSFLTNYLTMRETYGGSLESPPWSNEFVPAPAAWFSAQAGHTECLRLLIKAGSKVNAKGWLGASPASAAADGGHLDCLSLLIEAGCSINTRDDKGLTPISHAAKNGHGPCLRILLDRGGEIDSLDFQGLTAACHAARRGQSECLAILIAAGCSLDPFLKKTSRGDPASQASAKIPAWIKGECRDILEGALAAEECRRDCASKIPHQPPPRTANINRA